MAIELETDNVARAYDRWAPVYDLVFGRVFEQGRRQATDAAKGRPGRVLEVGVGTGISLADYQPHHRIVGIDISEPMLRKARKRVQTLHLQNVEALSVMDAEQLQFDDNSFDLVVAHYVVSAVPDPEAALNEFARVLKPGGEIIVLTRLGADAGMRRAVEHAITPLTSRLGWRAEFLWERYARWLATATDIELIERRTIPPLGHFSLLRFGKRSSRSAAVRAVG